MCRYVNVYIFIFGRRGQSRQVMMQIQAVVGALLAKCSWFTHPASIANRWTAEGAGANVYSNKVVFRKEVGGLQG